MYDNNVFNKLVLLLLKMPRLLLVVPGVTSGVGQGVRKGATPPLNLGIVASYTPENYDIKIIDENFERIDFDSEVDLVAITSDTLVVLRTYEIAVEFMIRGVPVIIGGIHASFMPEEAKQFCTSVVIGEAEAVWPRLLKDFEKGKLKPFYKSKLMDLRNLKKPRRDLYPEDYLFETVQTSRGCPFNCDFCSVTAFNGGKYRYRDIDEVMEEVSEIRSKNLFIIDDNILGVGKKAERRTMALLKKLKSYDKRWLTQASVNIYENDRVLKALADSGCVALFLGFESLSSEFLKSVNKGVNLKRVKKYKQCIEKLHDYGLLVIGSFMVGHDYETKESIRQTADFIIDNAIDASFLATLTPYVGTRFYNRLRKNKRLIHDKWWLCDPKPNVVIKPKKMTPKELFDSIVENSLRINSVRNNLSRFFKGLIKTRSFYPAAFSCLNNFTSRNHFKEYKKRGIIEVKDTDSKEDVLKQRLNDNGITCT